MFTPVELPCRLNPSKFGLNEPREPIKPLGRLAMFLNNGFAPEPVGSYVPNPPMS